MQEFENRLLDVLEVDAINDEDKLEDFECWDSLTQLSIIALANELFRVTLSAKEIKEAASIGGLKSLIESKK